MITFVCSKTTDLTKPSDYRVRELQNPAQYETLKCDVAQIATLLSAGHTWRAGIYAEGAQKFIKANVVANQVLALDFDACERTPDEVCEVAISIGLMPTLYYYSFSQGIKPHNNFRILWILEEPIKPIQYENIIRALMDNFPESDKSAKDCSRMWFGSNQQCHIINETPTKLSDIGWAGVMKSKEKGIENGKIKKKVKACENRFFEDPPPEAIKVKDGWMDALAGWCPLFDKFLAGEYLNYNQRLVLFSNLKFIKYADTSKSIAADLKAIYRKYEKVYSAHTFSEAQIENIMRDRTLSSRPIVLVGCEYMTVLEFFKRGIDTTQNATVKVSFDELNAQMEKEMPGLLSGTGISYITSPMGAGKTEHVIRWLLKQNLSLVKIIYSAPTYMVLKEFCERFQEQHLKEHGSDCPDVFLVPEAMFSEKDVVLLDLGLYPGGENKEERARAFSRLKDPKQKGLMLCSHTLLANIGDRFVADRIFIDENIEDCLIQSCKVERSFLRGIVDFMTQREDKEYITSLADEMGGLQNHTPVDIRRIRNILNDGERFSWRDYMLYGKEHKGIGAIYNLMPSATVKKSEANGEPAIRITSKSRFFTSAQKNGTPIVLLSATPQSAKLGRIYPGIHIENYEFPVAEHRGKIIQYVGRSFARGKDNSRIPALIEYVKSQLPAEDIENSILLTFKGKEDMWKKAGFHFHKNSEGKYIHLLNCAGLDCLKGKNIIVVGKPDKPDMDYLDDYYDFHDIDEPAPCRINQTLRVGGRVFMLSLWNDEALRKEQMDFIKKNSIQAYGRARTLREASATVHLFCDFPVEEADEYIGKGYLSKPHKKEVI